MRTEQEIFDDLAELCAKAGFVHAIAWFCLRDNLIVYEDRLKAGDLKHLYSDQRLIRTEVNTLLGLVAKTKLDFTLPEADVYKDYCDQAEALLYELHVALSNGPMADLMALFEKGPVLEGDVSAPILAYPLKGPGLLEPFFYSGDSAWSFQFRDLAPVKYSDDRAWLLANKGFDLDQARLVAKALLDLFNDAAVAAIKASKKLNSYMPFLGAFMFTVEAVAKRSQLEPATVQSVVDAFTLPEGERNASFKSMSDFNAITATPILKADDAYFLLDYYNLPSALYETPIYWMTADDAYKQVAFDNRADFLEELAYMRLAAVFGAEHVYLNVIIPGKKGEILGEIDTLVFYAGIAIVVQAKTRRLSIKARKGNDQQIQDDFKAAVQDAYDQALDCGRRLLDPATKLLDADGNALTFSSPVTSVFPICLVGDHYPALALQAREFLKTQDQPGIHAPLVIDVFALDTIAEMLESPLRFLSYLDLRARFGDKLNATHEVTLLADHIRRNLWIDGDYDFVHLHDDLTVDLEVAMMVRREGVAGKRTPDGILTRFVVSSVGRLLRQLEARPRPGMIDLGLLLLQISEKTTADLSLGLDKIVRETRRDRKLHDLHMLFGDAKTGLTIYCAPDWSEAMNQRFSTHCRVKKHQMQAETWYGLVLDPAGDLRIGLELEESWQPDAELDQLIAAHFTAKPLTPAEFHRHLKKDIKVGRNDPCPCGSGRKYKKCCYVL